MERTIPDTSPDQERPPGIRALVLNETSNPAQNKDHLRKSLALEVRHLIFCLLCIISRNSIKTVFFSDKSPKFALLIFTMTKNALRPGNSQTALLLPWSGYTPLREGSGA